MRTWSLLSALLACCIFATAATAQAAGFRNAPKTIRCATKGASVTCTITHQKNTAGCTGYTARGTVKSTGKSKTGQGCFSDHPLKAKRYRKAKSFKHRGVSCKLSKTSVTCVNKSKHGFELYSSGSRTF